MPMSPEFQRKLSRARRLFIQELKDGCLDCGRRKFGWCDKHREVVADVIDHPKKLFRVTNTGVEYSDYAKEILSGRNPEVG